MFNKKKKIARERKRIFGDLVASLKEKVPNLPEGEEKDIAKEMLDVLTKELSEKVKKTLGRK